MNNELQEKKSEKNIWRVFFGIMMVLGIVSILIGLVGFSYVLSVWVLDPLNAADNKFQSAYALALVISGMALDAYLLWLNRPTDHN